MAKRKHRNTKPIVDGIEFDSKKEAERYKYLRLLERNNEIKDLKLQPKFELIKGVKFSGAKRAKPAIRYLADFEYIDVKTGQRVVEDVKSPHTAKLPVYRMKKHMMLAIHGIEIKEV